MRVNTLMNGLRAMLWLTTAGLMAVAHAEGGTAYTVLMSGAAKGELVLTVDGATREARLRYEDRGRGPDLRTRSRFDADGLLTHFSVEGVNYAKQPVSERFTAENGRARWSGGADSGEATAGGYYLANHANAEDRAALARALLQAPAAELALLPAGRAGIRKALTYTIATATDATSATLYLIPGLDLQPQPVWLDGRLELFASGGHWLSVIRRGYENTWPALVAAQEDALAADAAARAGTLQQTPQDPVLIRNATVFDAEARRLLPRHSVLLRGTRIEAVGPDGRIRAPRGAQVIDAGGGTLLPGLWDMHVHVQGQHDGLLALLSGITTVRDLGNDTDTLTQLSTRFDSGALAGPWIIKAALIDKPGEFAGPTRYLVNTPAAMRETVAHLADLGYVQIKFYSALTPELIATGVAAARERELRTSGHVPAGMTMRQAVEAGFDEIQHANFWFLNFMSADIVARTHTPVRFSAPAQYARDLDLSSAPVRELIKLLQRKGTVLDPTLGIFESMFVDWKGDTSAWLAPWASRLPAPMIRAGRSGGRATTPEERATFAESFTRMQEMLRLMYEAGIPIVPGTDGSALRYSRELELYVEAGIPAQEVLYMATLGSACVMGQDKQTGSITPGKRADLVLIDGNPLRRMGAVRNVLWVVKGGVFHDADALRSAAGLLP
jgi:imidazolonepropionase-like amidohydrolase